MTESNRPDAAPRSAAKQRLACFLVPVVTAMVLLYQVLTDLRIAVLHDATLLIIGVTLAIAVAAGVIAALGPAVVRVAVLTLCALVFLDVTFRLPGLFERLQPQGRKQVTRDEQRIADIHKIKAALDQYLAQVGPLPSPADYGEATGLKTFWQDWWDTSSQDGDGDKLPFLDFLVDSGILASVPVDPVNKGSADDDPRGGQQYVYFVVPPDHQYGGGTCDASPNRWHYMIAITDLEQEPRRSPKMFPGSGCSCLWKDLPDYFQKHFDYILCGSFERTGAALAAQEKALARTYLAQDERRVADLLSIQQGLQKYIREVGLLPTPAEYGEAEPSKQKGFWKGYWDISSADGNGDGNLFLDFLVDSGTMPSVPVDPENLGTPDGDPRGGRQYVYYVIPPEVKYEGGSCGTASGKWVYMLGITDLRSQVTRTPTRIAGSGCDCLWRNKPNWFQRHFDYVVCGTFEVTPKVRARATAMRQKHTAAALARKHAQAVRVYGAQDQRRIADLQRIEEGLKTYLKKVGPLPKPGEYGEAERSSQPVFWKRYWDVSSEDGDGDGRPFLDFLVESGTMPAVPVDPVNERGKDGDPRDGRQYVYYVAAPGEKYGGGTCGSRSNEWVYMLGITDLQSELTRPPTTIRGSGCECLWRDQPNFFQKHFDYVTCGTFRR
ncbi:MAG: hypothetical protein ACJ74H_01675 [Thermoanaerobaculia bacterium]